MVLIEEEFVIRKKNSKRELTFNQYEFDDLVEYIQNNIKSCSDDIEYICRKTWIFNGKIDYWEEDDVEMYDCENLKKLSKQQLIDFLMEKFNKN